MSYEMSDVRQYSWGSEAFGNSTITHKIIGPKGKKGVVRDISVDLTVAAVGTTTVPEIDVGTASGDSTFARYRLGSTAILGYAIGFWEASNELITGNPPRNLQDYAGHVQLDGYPLGNQVNAGGTSLTVVPLGVIPASGMVVVNDISGTAGVCRLTLRDPLPPSLVVGQTLYVHGIQGETGANGQNQTISALNAAGNWIELTGTTFAGAYTGGGVVDVVAVVTEKAGTGGAPAGTGVVTITIQWIGTYTP